MIRLLCALLLASAPAMAADQEDGQPFCCCAGAALLILAAIGFSQSRKDPSSVAPPAAPAPSTSGPGVLQIRVIPGMKDFGSGSMECFYLKMLGPVNLPPANLTAVFNLVIWDVTGGEEPNLRKAVFCSIPALQLKGTQVFFWTHVMRMPYAQSMISDWTELVTIPVETLTFPARGERQLLFEFSISALGDTMMAPNRAVCRYTHTSVEWGYIDGIRMRIKAEEMGLKFAAAVSAVDGEQYEREKAVVRKWMDSRIESLPEDMRADTTRALSRALMIAERLGACIKPEEIHMMVEELYQQYPVASLPRGDLYDVVKLCMEVAAADGTAGPGELKLIDRISELLQVDRETFTKYRDRLLPAGIHSEKDTEAILGIDPSWPASRKKKHLRGLYREWSSRVTHSDPGIREQADEMLNMIAEERAKLDADD